MGPDREKELLAAIKEDDVVRVGTLLSEVAAPVRVQDESGVSAVLLAVYYGRRAIAEMLAKKWTPLDVFEAAAIGDDVRVRELIADSPKLINAYSPDGFPLLALAATFGHPETVTFLLAKGAEVDAIAKNGTGYTALTGAVSHRRPDIIAALLAKGADATYRYGPGWSPLHEAAMYGDVEVIRMLLDHGAELNARNAEGKTPLRLALDERKMAAAEILRAKGAVE